MNTEWNDMLQASGAKSQSLTDATVELKTYVSDDNPQLSDLSSYRVFEISGADTTAFLQGQFCNDIGLVSPMKAQITGYCTPKGRLLALPIILGFEHGYRMMVPADIAEPFIKRLSMFVMRSDVTIKALEDWVVVGITADTAGNLGKLESALGALPVGTLSVSSSQNEDQPGQIIRWHDDYSALAAGAKVGSAGSTDVDTGSAESGSGSGNGSIPRPRYLRLAPVGSQLELWKLVDDTHRHPSFSWRLADISAAIPNITQGIIEAFVPQMMNLQLINGLSFTKGCYPGQEIVARMQYLGKLKRHMRVFSLPLSDQAIDINEMLKPGSALSCGTDQNAGMVVDAIPLSSEEALVLAVTKVTASQASFELAGVPLVPRATPYELPSLEVA